jgi:ABC-type branched-subunit amino acid transport system substrate-binding protein
MIATMDEAWRIGLLFSRSGVTGLSDSEHFYGAALAIEEVNRRGGVLGRPIDVVAYDPASDPILYRDQAERLMTVDRVPVIFGCHTSVGRKAVLRTIERRNGVLWYPSMYEGFEYSPNVIYTGAVANQCAFPLIDFLFAEYGTRFAFVGAEYIFPREMNRVLRDLIEVRGGEVLDETYLPLAAEDAQLKAVVARIARLKPDVVICTLVGESGRRLYRMYHDAGIDRHRRPIASLTMAETEIREVGAEKCTGHITSAAYFSTIDLEANHLFVSAFAARFGPDRITSMWSAASYAQIMLFAQALEVAGTLDAQRLVDAVLGTSIDAPEGTILIDADTNHAWLTPRIGRVGQTGEFEIVWEAPELVRPDPYLAVSAIEQKPRSELARAR